MWGFSKKRFVITLGLSVVVWVISLVIQFLSSDSNPGYGMFALAKSCEVTGYPIAQCIPEHDKSLVYINYFVNILIWFLIIHLLSSLFYKPDSPRKSS